jgi:hypothetical protein
MDGLTLEKLRQAKEKLGNPDNKSYEMVIVDTPRNVELLRQFKKAQEKHDKSNVKYEAECNGR